jgi:hypothetical protein
VLIVSPAVWETLRQTLPPVISLSRNGIFRLLLQGV